MPRELSNPSITVDVCIQHDDSLLDDSMQSLEMLPTPSAADGNQPALTMELADIQSIPWSDWFTRWLTDLAPQYSPLHAYELTLRLTSDRGIQRLNAEYRDRDRSTDVLAFAAIDSNYTFPDAVYETQPYYLGDLVISLETASIQATEAKHSLSTELAWLSSHGLLHLLGWDHPNEESLKSMLDKQKALIALINPVSSTSSP